MCAEDWSLAYKRWHLNIPGKTTKTSFLKTHFQFSASKHFPVANNNLLFWASTIASSSSLHVTVIAIILPLTGDYHLCVALCLCYDCCLTLTSSAHAAIRRAATLSFPELQTHPSRSSPETRLPPRGAGGTSSGRQSSACWHWFAWPLPKREKKGALLPPGLCWHSWSWRKKLLENHSASQLNHGEGPKPCPQGSVRRPDVITGFLYSYNYWFALRTSHQYWTFYLLVK